MRPQRVANLMIAAPKVLQEGLDHGFEQAARRAVAADRPPPGKPRLFSTLVQASRVQIRDRGLQETSGTLEKCGKRHTPDQGR